jgi:hypothetical protein
MLKTLTPGFPKIRKFYQNFNDLFDKIVYINLPERKERNDYIQKLFKDNNIIADRIDGIHAEKPVIGCSLAHLNALKILRDSNFNNILIFEDDIIFKIDYKRTLFASLDFKWDLIYFGGSYFEFTNKNYKNFHRISHGCCTHAYAVNKACVIRIIKEIELKLTYNPIDIIYCNMMNNLLTWAIQPDLCFQLRSKFKSDILNRSDQNEKPFV